MYKYSNFLSKTFEWIHWLYPTPPIIPDSHAINHLTQEASRRRTFIISDSHYIELNQVLAKVTFPTYSSFLQITSFLEINIQLNLFLVRSEAETKFFLYSETCNTFLRVATLPNVIFKKLWLVHQPLQLSNLPCKSYHYIE